MKPTTSESIPFHRYQDYTVFSRNINTEFFNLVVPGIKKELESEFQLYACPEHFEELVGESLELQKEYVEYYHSENEFFITQKRQGTVIYDIYFIARYNEILLLFIRISP